MTDLSWQDRAACKGENIDLFYPPRHVPATAAKRICRDCLVQKDCLIYALKNEENSASGEDIQNVRDGSLENSLDCNSQEDNCAGYYKLYPPQIIKCNLCDNFKVRLLPRGRSDMMEHMEESHNLTFQESMRRTALLPTMRVVDLDVL